MKKKVAFNAYTINKPVTGVGRYTQMLSYLDDKKIYKVGLCFNKFHYWDNGFNEVLSSNIYSKIPKLFWNYLSKDLRNKFDFLHSPFPSLPLFRSKKSIITIHDLIFLTNPKWYSGSELIFIKNSLKHALKHSNYIICVSNSTKNQLIYHFPKVENKIKVIHNCFPPAFRPAVHHCFPSASLPAVHHCFRPAFRPAVHHCFHDCFPPASRPAIHHCFPPASWQAVAHLC